MVANGPKHVEFVEQVGNVFSYTEEERSQTVAKPKSSFPSFPRGRDLAKAHKAARSAAAKVQTTAASPKVSKPAVETASGVKPLLIVRKSTKQYAVSAVQGQTDTRASGAHSRYCPVDRFGSYTRGERKVATSAVDNERQLSVNPDQEVINLNSDDNDVQMVDPPAKKQRIVDDNSLWADLFCRHRKRW